ncbi:LOW QUALITY PROTEIN: dynein beta chain, ciliary-like [Paramacrobiotus metropolitanus]|uniref:LOW QUALITY PROTEIN: dynein beta chain, ciliary-like n=1 Tax=Paramacrobiotus metropolitanus TaxID=2943436 RepID=UPI002445C446|nr:LOW QUALITY PROTEIN: dynein beta chain, ciliary-like [Paramacrobiotus metropolitanus]
MSKEQNEQLVNISSELLKLKPDKTAKAFASDAAAASVKAFLSKEQPFLVVSPGLQGIINVENSFPGKTKGRQLIMYLKGNSSNEIANIQTMVLEANPCTNLLFYYDLIDEMARRQSQEDTLPFNVVKETENRLSRCKFDTVQLASQFDSMVAMPMPTLVKSPFPRHQKNRNILQMGLATVDRNTMTELKQCILKWCTIIQELYDQKEFADTDEETGAGAEIRSLHRRVENFESALVQITVPLIRILLEDMDEEYFSVSDIYVDLIDLLSYGYDETRTILKDFRPVARFAKFVADQDMNHTKPYIQPLFDVVAKLLQEYKEYFKGQKAAKVLEDVGKYLIEVIKNKFEAADVFKADTAENLQRTNEWLAIWDEQVRSLVAICQANEAIDMKLTPSEGEKDSKRHNDISEFSGRLAKIKHILQRQLEFQRLEKVEIGGRCGKTLSTDVVQLHTKFTDESSLFSGKSFDPLDLSTQEFEQAAEAFLAVIQQMDDHLLNVVWTDLEACLGNTPTTVKHMDMLNSVIYDKATKASNELSMFNILESLNSYLVHFEAIIAEASMQDDHKCAEIFTYPRLYSVLKWSYGVEKFLMETYARFAKLIVPHSSAKTYENLLDGYIRIAGKIARLQSDARAVVERLNAQTDQNLQHYSLVTRNASEREQLTCNLTNQLEEYLELTGENQGTPAEKLPPEIAAVTDKFRDLIYKLQSAVRLFNKIKQSSVGPEKELLGAEFEATQAILARAENKITWGSADAPETVEKLFTAVFDLSNRLKKAQRNLFLISKNLQQWQRMATFSVDPQQPNYLRFAIPDATRKERTAFMKTAGEAIQFLFQTVAYLFHANRTDKEWMKYADYVDGLVLDGLIAAAANNLEYILDHMSYDHESPPFIKVILTLKDNPGLAYIPGIGNDAAPDSLYSEINSVISDVFNIGTYVQRLSVEKSSDTFLGPLSQIKELQAMKAEILRRITEMMPRLLGFKEAYQKYSRIWEMDKQVQLTTFQIKNANAAPQDTENAEGVSSIPPLIDVGKIEEEIENNTTTIEEIEKSADYETLDTWLRVDFSTLKQKVVQHLHEYTEMLKDFVFTFVTTSAVEFEKFTKACLDVFARSRSGVDRKTLVVILKQLAQLRERQSYSDELFEPLNQSRKLLKQHGVEIPEDMQKKLQGLQQQWIDTKNSAVRTKQDIATILAQEVDNLRKAVVRFEMKQHEFREQFRSKKFSGFPSKIGYVELDKSQAEITALEAEMDVLIKDCQLFDVPAPDFKQLRTCRREVKLIKQLWDYASVVASQIQEWRKTPWAGANIESMDGDCKFFLKELRGLDKESRQYDVFVNTENDVKNMITSLRAVSELQSPAVRPRHWEQLMQTCGATFEMSPNTKLGDLLNLQLHKFEDEVKSIVDRAGKETGMEKTLRDLNTTWTDLQFEIEVHHRTGTQLVKMSDELVETLEENQMQLQALLASKYVDFFRVQVTEWQKKLAQADQVSSIFQEVQKTWTYLETIFIGSEDIRRQLPDDAALFDSIDKEFKVIAAQLAENRNVLIATAISKLYERLEHLQTGLGRCEQALSEYLEKKRLAFPRFYFVSNTDLLDILSNGNSPDKVAKHFIKLFDSLAALTFKPSEKGDFLIATEMKAKDGEVVKLKGVCNCDGQVESWLNNVLDIHRKTIQGYLKEAVTAYEDKPREQWIFDYPAQVALAGSQIWWTSDVNLAFSRLEEGMDTAMKDFLKKLVQQLNTLVSLLLNDLTFQQRQCIETIATLDVHNRDTVGKLVTGKVDHGNAFAWQSQLRHRWDFKNGHCYANICDAQFQYDYEYLGNGPRLVVTPLTDRCYITLTQSLHLILGGAPAGPAGTGKTETTKDLGKALGIMVYVFNCSEQMDYKSVGNIYKGLSQTGAWGCFDEFNRISVEVLSVVAVQVKCVLDAIRARKKKFNFLGEDIVLRPSVGFFITMNPGYAGRAELPENLKALFRPCAMVVPDFELIAEINLVSKGFINAKLLARKFVTLYGLCKELLSKQAHYDWGLRAIKSVLVVAGVLKRADKDRSEDQVLMRALRDFNIPKIVTDDIPVFMGLISDLFPSINVPRKRDREFESNIRKATLDLKLQPEDMFVLKVVQFQELLDVRHSVFILGNAGTGKTQVWKTLYKTYQNARRKPMYSDLNPKAVTNDELFGIINPSTREWKDGLFAVIMRDLANATGEGPKWIVLDGDIDPMWIESLNTVMDDNKVLTLASNERIALSPNMRLVFEISHLKTATPATVSRAGILFLNVTDIGWMPFVSSWMNAKENPSEKQLLGQLFDRHLPLLLDAYKTKLKTITPLPDISLIQTLCALLDATLPQDPQGELNKDAYETMFHFACIWAFGGPLLQDQTSDMKVEFNSIWNQEFKNSRFSSPDASVFDFYYDSKEKQIFPWTNIVSPFVLDGSLPVQAQLVQTADTVRIRYLLNLLISVRKPAMLVGPAGSGKSVIMADVLRRLPADDYAITQIAFNFYTTSLMLQNMMEKPLEKKSGRSYGPVGNKRMIYFIDDMNMPEVDKYFTVQPHTIIKQHIDYGHWYDRQKLFAKDIINCQYLSCMNPAAGSFTITPRLQRHFSVFTIGFPSADSVQKIYGSFAMQHFERGFTDPVKNVLPTIVQAAMALHNKVASSFLPTAVKFHYLFNLRDLSTVFQGLLFSRPDIMRTKDDMVKVWMHESLRVYQDKLIAKKDSDLFTKILGDIGMKYKLLTEAEFGQIKFLPHCHFANGLGDPKYAAVKSYPAVQKVLTDALPHYNEELPAMNLVLFQDAIEHICRINRILELPRANALLVGVGGSGKQSLARLAAYISGMQVVQITLRKGYAINDLKADFADVFRRCGVKNENIVFLMTDSQVPEENFLVLINDLLASGEIPDLFPADAIEDIIGALRNEVKANGLNDDNSGVWRYFLDRVRRNLKVILCFSPVGPTLRMRSRKFPAVTNCTSIDWFHDWPQEALISVSKTFLQTVEVLPAHLRESIAQFMAFVHSTVNDISVTYLQNERRHNYTTPKSFLEHIRLYSTLLTRKVQELQSSMNRLENGLQKIRSTATQVDDMKAKLASKEKELAIKNEETNRLIEVAEKESAKVAKEKEIASNEEKAVAVVAKEVEKKQKDCEKDLALAEPSLRKALAALDTLDKNNLTELKSFGSPPPICVDIAAAVMILLAPNGRVPKDKSWKASKVMMAKVDLFLEQLKTYDKEHIHENCLKAVDPFLKKPEFQDPASVESKSRAAAGLCAWVVNIVNYYRVYCDVEPKRITLQQANAELTEKMNRLAEVRHKVAKLESERDKLLAQLKSAVDERNKTMKETEATSRIIVLANRLMGGLASENVRWANQVQQFKKSEESLPGDVLLVSAFVSYVGTFTRKYRQILMEDKWKPYMNTVQPKIPTTSGIDFLTVLTDDAIIANWQNQGLPADRMSTENAVILTISERWPLIIDPQLQGSKWIKGMYAEELQLIRLGQKGYLDQLEFSLSSGSPCFLENIGETVDPILDPLISRNTVKKGRAIKMGEKEVEYNPKFRLILHTKLANPHYRPEMQAQCAIINFTVTRSGLEDQLLAAVVRTERPDLEQLKSDLTKQQNDFKITLKRLEDSLLKQLSAAEGNFLGNVELVESLELNKRTAIEVERKVAEAQITEQQINTARETYRPAAARASLLYFILNEMNKINPIYQFSLEAFNTVFRTAIARATQSEDPKERVKALIDSITYCVFIYTTRGLFERDKIIFTALMAFQVLQQTKEITATELDFFLRLPSDPSVTSPVDFLSDACWGTVKVLAATEEFKNLDKDIEGSAKRWKKIVESDNPEREKLPQEWKGKSALQRMMIMRALRPDRMVYAVRVFVEEKLGERYVENRAVEFGRSFEESGPSTPMFFVLSPGVDPLKDVEALGRKLGFTFENQKFHNVSLGQGQEPVADRALEIAAEKGHWVILQNIHLVKNWLPKLEKNLDRLYEGAHNDFRVFMSAEPAAHPSGHILPQGLLENSIKITNEPPTGMLANLHKALDYFNQETLEMCSRETEFKCILFALCYFHAVVAERRKFGPQGWNRSYPFNAGDLVISSNVLFNYLENNAKVPWTDLRYLFGEIMYGGHITDDWDRRLCRAYLEEFLKPEMIDGDFYLAPGFRLPPPTDYKAYHAYIDESLPNESPYLYGLHPNAEIGFLTATSENLFRTVLEMQPRDTSEGGGAGGSRDEKLNATIESILSKLSPPFSIVDLYAKAEDRTPYTVVALQECERMNTLTQEMKRSLKELKLGLKGELTISAAMDELSGALFLDQIPQAWAKFAYPSLRPLSSWSVDLQNRVKELEQWTTDFKVPCSVWLGGLFNPQSFLTAIMQVTARKNEWPLDRMTLQIEITKKQKDECQYSTRDGSYIHGLYMEGARWDMQMGSITDSKMKELFCPMPVIFVKAIPADKEDSRSMYDCPVYKIKTRGPDYVVAFKIKAKDRATKWILAGVALLLEV